MEPLYPRPDAGFDMTFIGTSQEVDLYQHDNDPIWWYFNSSKGSSWVNVPRTYFVDKSMILQDGLRPALPFATAHYNLSH